MDSALIKEITFQIRQNEYELQNNRNCTSRLVRSVHKDLESLAYLGFKV